MLNDIFFDSKLQIVEIIQNNKSGILVDYKDHKLIHKKIIDICEEEKLLNILAKNAYERFLKKFTIETSGKNLIKIIHES